MTADAPFQPPRKKLNILWLLAGVLFLLVALFFMQLFGPNPRIIVAPQTTYITKPLGPDGLPDYERYVMEADRRDVSASNNAAVLLWQAIWPGELSPQQYAPMAKELGLSQIPSTKEALVSPYGKVVEAKVEAWLQTQPTTIVSGDPSEMADRIFDRAMTRPWTSDQIPPLATWVAENQKPLDLIVAASRRPRFYSPSPSLLDDKPDSLIAMQLPSIHRVRNAARSLSTRAMWHLGEGRPMEAWTDILAIHRLARLITQGRSLVEQLVGIAIDNIACTATQRLLQDRELSVDEIKQIRKELDSLPDLAGVARSLDQGERLLVINALVLVGTNRDEELMAALDVEQGAVTDEALKVVSVDWNLVLQEANQWYDRLVAAARLTDRSARKAALMKVNSDIDRLVREARTPTSVVAAVVSRRQRSELVSATMLGMFLPAVSAAVDREEHQNMIMEMTRLAAALAQFRAENGEYPEKLEELVPSVVEKLPADPYSGASFLYERDGEGFLLYSVGENGADDGGSYESMNIQAGHIMDDLDEAEVKRLMPQIPSGADDPSIRAPRPMFELPKPAWPSEP